MVVVVELERQGCRVVKTGRGGSGVGELRELGCLGSNVVEKLRRGSGVVVVELGDWGGGVVDSLALFAIFVWSGRSDSGRL